MEGLIVVLCKAPDREKQKRYSDLKKTEMGYLK